MSKKIAHMRSRSEAGKVEMRKKKTHVRSFSLLDEVRL